MTRRLIASYLVITVVVLAVLEIPLGGFYAQRERERVSADLEHDASVIATIYEDVLEAGGQPDPGPAVEYERRTGVRVVVVDTAGISVVDTDAAVDRDLSTRPEIASALAGVRATGTRHSDTLDTNLLYVSVPVASGGIVHGALRLTLDVSDVDQRIQRFWLGLAGVSGVVLVVMAVVGWAIAHSVVRPLRRLDAAALRYSEGDLTAATTDVGGPPELRALGNTLAEMANRLDKQMATQRAFVADASHQLRTPLTSIQLRLENLQSQLSEVDAAALEPVLDETSRLTALVGDLLHLARADARRPAEPTDLAKLAEDRVDTWSAVADEAELEIRLERPPSAATVLTVPGAVEQILDNLLDNALRAAPSGTNITVRVQPADDGFDLAVVDHGPGLTDDQKHKASQRFWRGSSTTPGTGLGLAIVESLALASGGRLDLRDTEGGGLTAIVNLPAVR